MSTCKERVKSRYESRLEDLQTLVKLYEQDPEAYDNDLGRLEEYGLSFDYVAPDTFTDQEEGYFRYQLSCGGPSDEFRFFVNPDLSPHRIEYWFLDWFDGANVILSGDEKKFMKDFFIGYFVESGSAEYQIELT